MEPQSSLPCSPELVRVLSHISAVHAAPTDFLILILISSHLCLCLPSRLLPSGFPTKTLYAPLLSHICATCPSHLILFLIIQPQLMSTDHEDPQCAVFSSPVLPCPS